MTQVQNQDWRSLQKQSTGVEDKVKLNVKTRIECKLVADGDGKKAVLSERIMGDDNKYSDKIYAKIRGVYVGSFMIKEGWDSNNVLFQTTNYFKTTDYVYINDRNKTFRGLYTAESAESEMIRHGMRVSSKVVVVVATDSGVVTIKTNAPLWINLFKKFQYNDIAKDYIIEFTAERFNPDSPEFATVSKDYSKKMTDGNYPACILLKQGEAIDSIKNVNDKYLLSDTFKNYIDYEKSIEELRPKNYTAPTPQNVVSAPQQNNTVPVQAAPFTAEEPGDDLPF